MFCGQVFLRCKIPCRDRLRNGVRYTGNYGSLEDGGNGEIREREREGFDEVAAEGSRIRFVPRKGAELIRPFEGKVYREEFRGIGRNGVSVIDAAARYFKRGEFNLVRIFGWSAEFRGTRNDCVEKWIFESNILSERNEEINFLSIIILKLSRGW